MTLKEILDDISGHVKIGDTYMMVMGVKNPLYLFRKWGGNGMKVEICDYVDGKWVEIEGEVYTFDVPYETQKQRFIKRGKTYIAQTS